VTVDDMNRLPPGPSIGSGRTRYRGPGFGEAQCRAAADVYQHSRFALDPNEIAARGAPVV
jgi:hypothetical protein